MQPYVKTIKGKEKGPVLAVFSGIHGNEKVGVLAVKEIIKEIKIKKGIIYFVVANPLAVKKNVRMLDKNLNRCFLKDNKEKNKEDIIARVLMKILDKSNALLDLHAFNDPKGNPFIICGKKNLNIASIFDVNIISYGWNKIEPGATDGYMENQNKIGICLECGPVSKPEEYKEFAKKQIYKFIDYFNLMDFHVSNKKRTNKKIVQVTKVLKAKTNNFNFMKDYKNFELLPDNAVFAIDGIKKIKSKKNECIIFPRKNQKIGAEACIVGKFVK
ncbi:succinylglutamate desuccinylase/aspartoacylase family protein [Candidatus Nomurabacteria bacterium]|nr:succinylglutamate desuccinylase/aspartoacylase family protein [Candidatus Nomurabacteria bacterium]